jgi:hypothetical protein
MDGNCNGNSNSPWSQNMDNRQWAMATELQATINQTMSTMVKGNGNGNNQPNDGTKASGGME